MATYSYPLALPSTPSFVDSSWKLQRAVDINRSPFSGHSSAYEYTMALWTAVLTLPPMKRDQAASWQAFFMKLHGRRGTFLLGDPDAKTIRGAGPSSGNVALSSAAAVGDDSLSVSITAPNGTVAFKEGDYIQLGTGSSSKLHMIVNDVVVNSNAATIDIEPYVKLPVDNLSVLDYTEPKGVFHMDSNELGWDADHVSKYGITFSCTEFL